jgi:tetratricopeptide (TPR) repeat protein
MSRFHGKIDESLWFYREALRGEHDPAARLHIEALMADLKGSKEEAQELWRAAGAIEPENPAHDLAAAEALKHDGSDERAGALLGRALRLDPGNLQARNLMLDILAWNGEHGRLQTEVERLYLDDPNAQVICDYAYFRLKKAKLSARESDHLRRLIVSGLKKTPGFPGLLHAQAAYHAVGRQWKKMAKHLDKLVLDYPARAECWTIRAVWLARLRLPGVSDSMRRAIILDPANPRLLETALYLAIRGRDAVLFRDIMKELPGPGSRNPRLLLAAAGGLLVILGDHAAAENMARRAVADCPSDPVVQFGLGRMLRLCGHTHEAVAAFSALWESIGQSPRHVLAPTVALQIGKCMAASGEREQTLRWCAAAHRCAEQFADLDPRAAADWNKLVAGIQSGNPAMFGADNEIWDSMPLPDPLYRPDFDR